MAKNTYHSALLVAVLAAAAAGSGCAKNAHPPTTAERAQDARGEMTDTEKLTATVESVDKANQTVILHDEQGRRFAMDVEDSALERLKPDDQIKVVYQEVLAFALEDPAKQTGPDQKVEETTERKSAHGVQVGRRISTTVQIVAVAPSGKSVKFRVPEGAVRTMAVEDSENQKEIENLQPGDSVRVTYTEKLALALEEPKT